MKEISLGNEDMTSPLVSRCNVTEKEVTLTTPYGGERNDMSFRADV